MTWTVADEALFVRWRYEVSSHCGFYVSVEKATINEQDGFLDFGTPDYLPAGHKTRSILIRGLLPDAPYRITVRFYLCFLLSFEV